mgnify:CR=1 FL=1
MKKLILAVCKGNIHRSVIAELCLRKVLQSSNFCDQYEVMSCGLQGSYGTDPPLFSNLVHYPLEWSLTKPILEDLEIEISSSRVATPVTREIADRSSIILAMNKKVLCGLSYSLVKQFPHLGFKMRLFKEIAGETDDIPDCAGKTEIEVYRNVILGINQIAQNHIGNLLKLLEIFSTYTNERRVP